MKIYVFGQGHSAHACKIWAGSDEKWMSSSQKTIIFSEKYFLRIFFDPKTGFWKFTFVGKVILHMPIKFEQARMKNEGGVRENVKWTYNERQQRTTTNDRHWVWLMLSPLRYLYRSAKKESLPTYSIFQFDFTGTKNLFFPCLTLLHYH